MALGEEILPRSEDTMGNRTKKLQSSHDDIEWEWEIHGTKKEWSESAQKKILPSRQLREKKLINEIPLLCCEAVEHIDFNWKSSHIMRRR